MRSRALAAAAGFLTLLSTSPAAAEKRIALVIGNSTYQNVTPLDNPSKDAELMADTLDGLGFTLIGGRAQLNLDKTAIDNAVQNFGRQVQGAEVALFYYAGHGVQVSGPNYLVPINANPSSVGNYGGITVISSGHVSGDPTDASGAGPRRNNSATFCS